MGSGAPGTRPAPTLESCPAAEQVTVSRRPKGAHRAAQRRCERRGGGGLSKWERDCGHGCAVCVAMLWALGVSLPLQNRKHRRRNAGPRLLRLRQAKRLAVRGVLRSRRGAPLTCITRAIVSSQPPLVARVSSARRPLANRVAENTDWGMREELLGHLASSAIGTTNKNITGFPASWE